MLRVARRSPEALARDHARLASFLVDLDYTRPRIERALIVAAGCEPQRARELHRDAAGARPITATPSIGSLAREERERDYDRAVADEHFVF